MDYADTRRSYAGFTPDLIPYLLVFLSWWILAMFTLTVRIPTRIWYPVLELFWGQALLIEKILPLGLLWASKPLWLVILLSLAVGCWYLIERGQQRDSRHVCRRAFLFSVAVQAVWFGLAVFLAPE